MNSNNIRKDVEVKGFEKTKILKACKNYLIPDMNSLYSGDYYWINEFNDNFTDWYKGGFTSDISANNIDYYICLKNKKVFKVTWTNEQN